jgi:uncharacterized OB-fold protein
MSHWDQWWEATERKELLVQQCSRCGHRQHYPRAVCLECGSDRLDWVKASGRAVIHSFTVSHRSPDPERFPPPYVVALVDLDEGPRMLTRILCEDFDRLRCDQPVSLTWVPYEDGRHLPVFEPIEKENEQ